MDEIVLVLAAHPDDEVLGCGGTIAKYIHDGSKVHVAFLADGVYSRSGSTGDLVQEKESRRAAAKAALHILGVDSVSFDEFPDNRMDSVPTLEVAKVIEGLIDLYKPKIVFTHHHGDVNIDHRKVYEATVVACRPQPNNSVKLILCYEVVSSTEWQLPLAGNSFSPDWFVDISVFLELKLQSLAQYEFELRSWPHPRSIDGVRVLANWRGTAIGVNAAEAFVLGRNIA